MGVRKRGKRSWQIDYYVDGQRVRETVKGPRRKAEELLIQRKAAALAGTLETRTEEAPLFCEVAERYLEWTRDHHRSARHDRSMLKRLVAELGNLSLDQVTPWRLEQMKSRMRREGLSGSRVNRYLACLSGLFHRAIDWGIWTGENPCKRVARYRESPGRVRYLSGEEIAGLLGACEPQLKPVVVVALGTGMRQGEIFKLLWQDVDLARGLIHVVDSKNGERREVPLGEEVWSLLRELGPQAGCKLVFGHRNGRPHVARMRRAFERARREAGLEGVRFHDLRHTFASHLVMSGASLFAVQELLGHKTLAMTRRYAHLSTGVRRQAVGAMDGLLRGDDALRRSQDGHRSGVLEGPQTGGNASENNQLPR